MIAEGLWICQKLDSTSFLSFSKIFEGASDISRLVFAYEMTICELSLVSFIQKMRSYDDSSMGM